MRRQRDRGAKSGAIPGVFAAHDRNFSPGMLCAPLKRPLTPRSSTSGVGTGTIVVASAAVTFMRSAVILGAQCLRTRAQS